MSIIIRSGDSADLATVNADGELRVRLTDDEKNAGYVRIAGSTYSGDEGEDVRVSEDGYLMVGQESMVFYDQVEGAALNSLLWATSTSTMTVTQSSGLIALNAGLSTTAGTYAIVSSIKHIPLYGQYPLLVAFSAAVNTAAQANATIEMGIGLAAGTAAPTDGAFVRFAPNGTMQGVVSFGGVESSAAMTFEDDDPFVVGNLANWLIIIDNDDVCFMYNGDQVATVPLPVNQPFPTANGRLPVFGRVYNGGSAPATAPRLQIGRVMVAQSVLNQERLWAQTLAGIGRGAYQTPVSAYAQTANHANSTSPSSATLSNSAAGYTTLGGRWQFAAPAGAGTDFALFGYQVPTGYQLFLTGIAISAINTGAAVATTATILDWAVGLNSSAVSLGTTDGASTWAPRRLPLGVQSFQVGAAVGAAASDIVRTFDAPLVVDSGRYLHVIVQVPVGTATASQVIRGTVTINGYFE